jgi:antitoxin (DNA-binding transcriptional repressor) of toxin-antitoxin stability system
MPAVTVTGNAVWPGEGTVLTMDGAPVAMVVEIDGPDITVAACDDSNLTRALRVCRPSRLPAPGRMTLRVWYDPNDTAGNSLFTRDSSKPGPVRQYQLILTNPALAVTATAPFSAFVTSFRLTGARLKSNIGADIELQWVTLLRFGAAPLPPGAGGFSGSGYAAVAFAGPLTR